MCTDNKLHFTCSYIESSRDCRHGKRIANTSLAISLSGVSYKTYFMTITVKFVTGRSTKHLALLCIYAIQSFVKMYKQNNRENAVWR